MDSEVLERDIKLPRQPLFSVRRLVIVAVLAAAFGLLVYGFQGTGSTGGNDTDDAIVRLVPERNDRVLRQAEVGAELKPGYDGRLTINGVAIPEDQMEGALTPEALAELGETGVEVDQGVRPNNKNSVRFQPGPGKAVADLDTGAVELQLRYWPIEDGPDNARTFTWTIYVT